MLEDLANALKAREEVVEFAGRKLLVRELESAADVTALQDDVDIGYKLIVRCVFDEQGDQVFADDDIPALKRASKAKFAPISRAVNRVNGFDVEDSAKNSDAAPT